MSDYISKSELVKTLEKYKFGAIENNDEREYTKEMVLLFVNSQPTVDEKEIIRKAFERVVERLENLYPINPYPNPFSNGRDYANGRAIQIVKEECGISE